MAQPANQPNVTQIPTAIVHAATEDPATIKGPIGELLHELGNAMGYKPEEAVVLVVRP